MILVRSIGQRVDGREIQFQERLDAANAANALNALNATTVTSCALKTTATPCEKRRGRTVGIRCTRRGRIHGARARARAHTRIKPPRYP